MKLTPEEQADGALALIWLCSGADVQLSVGKGKLILNGATKAPIQEIVELLRPYKSAIIFYLNRLELPGQALQDIDDAFDAAEWPTDGHGLGRGFGERW